MNPRKAGLLISLLVLLGGCTQLVDSDAARLCRSLLPVLDGNADRVAIVRTIVSGGSGVAERAVAIDYRTSTGTQALLVRRVTCLFDAPPAGAVPQAGAGAIANLSGVVTEAGALGPLRLHLLKQNWIARGTAATSDPAPFATLGRVPEVPRRLAIVAQNGLSALPVISIYALLAVAYALVYGLVGRINLAFGELTILAGYGAFIGFAALADGHGIAIAVAGALALGLFTGLANGAALGRWLVAPLAGRPGQHILIATVGLSLFWSELLRLSHGSSNRWIGPLFNRPLALLRNGDFVVTITPMALILPLVAGLAGVALLVLMQGTRFGRRWRAFSDDPMAAQLLGTDPQRLIFTTMLMASGAAALAGVLTTLYYGGVGFAGGQLVGLKALIAAVIGGIGSVPGALLGGIVLGLAEMIWSALFTIESRDPAIFTLLVVLLAFKPEGLLGVREDQRLTR